MMAYIKGVVLVLGFVLGSELPAAEPVTLTTNNDPHYTDAGFFDIHVCNWPQQPLFFLTLFSTYHFDKLARVEVYDSKGKYIGDIPLTRFRLIEQKGKPEKRAFLTQIPMPADSPEGWYTARAFMKDGSEIIAKDYVVIESMRIVDQPLPQDHSEGIAAPGRLRWNKIPGATYYQVFIRDMWEDGKTILHSKLLDKPELVVPKGLLKPGGWYKWRVHARDVNGNTLLGDFNHGSLSRNFEFSVAEQ
jgi:hypothetical protein